MFDLARFIEDCRAAVAEDPSHKAVREVVARAVSAPAEALKGVGEPKRGEVQKLYQSDELTILNVIWAPWMTILPHNHHMWAVIGIYTGREDNIFWRRLPGGTHGEIEAAGAKAMSERDAIPLGRDIIHSVTNPIRASPARSTFMAEISLIRRIAASGIRRRCGKAPMT